MELLKHTGLEKGVSDSSGRQVREALRDTLGAGSIRAFAAMNNRGRPDSFQESGMGNSVSFLKKL